MGGSAFAQACAPGHPTLNTPRMKADEYFRIKSAYVEKIRACCPDAEVTCLIEAPGKEDYGDVDVVVAVNERVDFIAMARSIGAAGVICHNLQKCSMAVALDGDKDERQEASEKGVVVVYEPLRGKQASPEVTRERYAQVDVDVVPPALLKWHRFYISYGDVAKILGRIVSTVGFRVGERGFWVRIEELDQSKSIKNLHYPDKEGIVFLSSDHEQVARFLGLSTEAFEQGFDTKEALYRWLAECRLISTRAARLRGESAHERSLGQKRAMYNEFFEEWLPAHMDLVPGQDAERDEVTEGRLRGKLAQESVDVFDKRAEYEAKRGALKLAIKNATATELIRKALVARSSGMAEKWSSEIIKAFRRNVGCTESGQPYILGKPQADAESQLHRFLDHDGGSLRESLEGWIEENWERVRGVEREHAKRMAGTGTGATLP